MERRQVSPEKINRFVSALGDILRNSNGLSMRETQLKFTHENYDLGDPSCLQKKVKILCKNLTPATFMEIQGIQEQSATEKWFIERWCRITASKCLPALQVGGLVVQAEQNAASKAFKFISRNIWGIDSEPFQSNWTLYGLESERSEILKYEEETSSKVCCSGLWVNPKLPFLACSPDGPVGKDTVVEIKSLKIFKQYSVQAVTSLTSVIPKEVLSRQCFYVKDEKCVLKPTHSCYYQCQHILLVTGKKLLSNLP